MNTSIQDEKRKGCDKFNGFGRMLGTTSEENKKYFILFSFKAHLNF